MLTYLRIQRIGNVHFILSEKNIGHMEVSSGSADVTRSGDGARIVNLRLIKYLYS